jgi:hypothetical protein
MNKYRYTIGQMSVETLTLSDIPEGVDYETITFNQEVEQEVQPTQPIANDIVIDLLTKQVEAMSEEEKSDILQTLLTQ